MANRTTSNKTGAGNPETGTRERTGTGQPGAANTVPTQGQSAPLAHSRSGDTDTQENQGSGQQGESNQDSE